MSEDVTRRPNRRREEALLRRIGYPADIPPVPGGLEQLMANPPIPGDWGEAARYVRSEGIAHALRSPAHWGVGVARDEQTGGPAIVFLAHPAPTGTGEAAPLPERVGPYPVRELPLAMDGLGHTFAPSPLIRSTLAGGFTGSAISNDPFTGPGGTLTGIFTSAGGRGMRGVTCSHVALGTGIQDLLQNLPNSLPLLFRSPAGQQMIVSGGPNIGQNMFQLFQVDTPWPMLAFLPFPFLPGVLTFLYVDVAAGGVRPTAIPNFGPPPAGLPARKTTVFGAQLAHGTFPVPGDDVYKIGQTTGVTWGTCLMTSLFIPIPVPLLPVIVLFWLNVHALAIAPGDSGALGTGNPGQEPYDIDGLGLGGTGFTLPQSINSLTLGVPFPVATLFAGIRN